MWTTVDAQKLYSLRLDEAWEREYYLDGPRPKILYQTKPPTGSTTCDVREYILLKELQVLINSNFKVTQNIKVLTQDEAESLIKNKLNELTNVRNKGNNVRK